MGRVGAAQLQPECLSHELPIVLHSVRNLPSEAWASWGHACGAGWWGRKRRVLQPQVPGSGCFGVWPGRAGLLGCRTKAPLGLPGQAQCAECASLSSPQPARSGAPGRRRAPAYQLLPMYNTSRVPAPPAPAPSVLPGRAFRAGPESSPILIGGLGFQPWTAGLGALGLSPSEVGDFPGN